MEAKTKIDEAELRSKFEGDPNLPAEFGSVEAFLCFVQAQAEGRVRGLKSSVVPASPAGTEAGAGGVDEETLKKEFAESADLRSEFGGVTAFLAFRKAEAAGRVGMCLGCGVVSFSAAPGPKEGKGEGLPISEPVRSAFKEASKISQAITQRRDEQRQYAQGVPCES